MALPTGTITFLFTDIQGSTALARELGSRWPAILAEHHDLVRTSIREHGGIEVSVDGDGFFAVFESATQAVAAAVVAQTSLVRHRWPEGHEVRVRMGLHTGEGVLSEGEYVGLDVHRAARIAASGYGGQVLLSDSARMLVMENLQTGISIHDLGEHRLKDFDEPRHIYQLQIEGLPTEFPPLKTLNIATNLPVDLTSFIGRERELAAVIELLRSRSLVTLTGTGGTGKTRLALRVASEMVEGFEDGVYLVELAPIRDPELLPDAIASVMGIRKQGSGPILDSLKSELRDLRTLLVLDNFEQLIQASPIVGQIQSAAPRLKVLVTSREPLRIQSEQEFPVPPLAVPEVGTTDVDELRKTESATLFLERSRAVQSGFDLNPGNAGAVADLCARLDGLPLAIELAAARVRLLEPSEILAGLDRSPSFLKGGRDVTDRQRTLHGAIEWSHDLLDESERVVFRRLSVFAGGFTTEAAEAVCLTDVLGLEVLDVISSLHEKSLLRRDREQRETLRMSMLQTIREYARERLESSGEGSVVKGRHASFFVNLAEDAAQRLGGPDEGPCLDSLDPELDNFRAVIGWAIESGECEIGLRVAASLSRFWLVRNHVIEGRRHIEALLTESTGSEARALRAAALGTVGDLAGWQADYDASSKFARAALAEYRAIGDAVGSADQMILMGYAAAGNDPNAALKLFTESIDLYRREGGPTKMGQALLGLSLPEMRFGKLHDAAAHLEEALELFEQVGDQALALVATGLRGICARLDGDLEGARRRYVEVLVRSQNIGAHFVLTLPLSALADLALVEGDPEKAVILEAAREQLAEKLGGTPSFQLMGIPDVMDRARAELGEERFAEAVTRGRSAPVDEIVEIALQHTEEAG